MSARSTLSGKSAEPTTSEPAPAALLEPAPPDDVVGAFDFELEHALTASVSASTAAETAANLVLIQLSLFRNPARSLPMGTSGLGGRHLHVVRKLRERRHSFAGAEPPGHARRDDEPLHAVE